MQLVNLMYPNAYMLLVCCKENRDILYKPLIKVDAGIKILVVLITLK